MAKRQNYRQLDEQPLLIHKKNSFRRFGRTSSADDGDHDGEHDDEQPIVATLSDDHEQEMDALWKDPPGSRGATAPTAVRGARIRRLQRRFMN
mmetsp:Transcript_18995/g.33456  ORF Transcript_18995/g.33456 Transcript_18995/m.33456 type:complete len:93 (-) Transcript_18995:351-629(-)